LIHGEANAAQCHLTPKWISALMSLFVQGKDAHLPQIISMTVMLQWRATAAIGKTEYQRRRMLLCFKGI